MDVTRAELSAMKRVRRGGWTATVLGAAAFFAVLVCGAQSGSTAKPSTASTPAKSKKATTTSHSAAHGSAAHSTAHVATTSAHTTSHTSKAGHKQSHKPLTAKQLAKSQKLRQAFVASSQLRPMAQQLATMRSPAAYAGVSAYAHAHTGEAAAAAHGKGHYHRLCR